MLILANRAEGVVRTVTDGGTEATLALAEVLLALGFFGSAVFYARLSRTH